MEKEGRRFESRSRRHRKKKKKKKKIPRGKSGKKTSRGWFRSIDLWVMGPARSRCATLLLTLTQVRQQDIIETHSRFPLGHRGRRAAAFTTSRRQMQLECRLHVKQKFFCVEQPVGPTAKLRIRPFSKGCRELGTNLIFLHR